MTTYRKTWRNKLIALHTENIDELIDTFRDAVIHLEEMKADGLAFDFTDAAADYIFITTSDPILAEKYGFTIDKSDVSADPEGEELDPEIFDFELDNEIDEETD